MAHEQSIHFGLDEVRRPTYTAVPLTSPKGYLISRAFAALRLNEVL